MYIDVPKIRKTLTLLNFSIAQNVKTTLKFKMDNFFSKLSLKPGVKKCQEFNTNFSQMKTFCEKPVKILRKHHFPN